MIKNNVKSKIIINRISEVDLMFLKICRYRPIPITLFNVNIIIVTSTYTNVYTKGTYYNYAVI